MTSYQRILIVRLGALGDVLHVLPALTVLHRSFPEARITWIVESLSASLLQGHPYLAEILVLPRKEWTARMLRLASLPSVIRESFGLLRDLRERRFDLAFDFQGNLRSGIVTWLSGARVRVGFARKASREGNHLFHTVRVRPEPPRLHKVEKNLALLARMGLDVSGAEPVLPRMPDAAAFWDTYLSGLKRPVTVVHAGVSRFGQIKTYPARAWAEAADGILDRSGGTILLTWGPGEKEGSEGVAQAMRRSKDARLTPEPSGLLHLSELLRQVDLVAGVDTGPVHLAAALGTRVLGLYGPKDPQVYGPSGRGARCIQTEESLPCLPCNLHRCPIARPDGLSPCMAGITPKAVADAAATILRTEGVAT